MMGLNVRRVEAMARECAYKNGKSASGRKPRGATVKAADTLALEKRMSDALGLTVSIDDHGDRGGTLSIRYRSLDQLDDVLARLERRH